MSLIDEILQIDLDANGFPLINEKNIKLINFCISNDSRYRNEADSEYPYSIKNLVQEYIKNPTADNLMNLIENVDKQNSTHLSVSGKNKDADNKQGRELTKKYLMQIPDLIDKIISGDHTLVNNIAKNAITKNNANMDRYIISFASKFCTYILRYHPTASNKNHYSIYDSVLSDILPYYYYQYVHHKTIDVRRDTLKELPNGYEVYNNYIKEIIDNSKCPISREDFDHLLWYYFKGDRDIKDKNYQSRTTKAIACIKS